MSKFLLFLLKNRVEGSCITTCTSHCACIPQIFFVCIRKLCQQTGSELSVSGNICLAPNVHCSVFVLMFLFSLSCGKVLPWLLYLFCPILRFCCVQLCKQLFLHPFLKEQWHFWATFAIVPSFSSQKLLLFIPFSDSAASRDIALFSNCSSLHFKEYCTSNVPD